MKKLLIVLGVLFTFAASTMAQNLKFAHVNAQAVIMQLPARADAEKQLQAFAKQLEDELGIMSQEFENKYKEYMAKVQDKENPMSDLKRQTVEKELQELQARVEGFRNSAPTEIQKKEQELLNPLVKQVQDAIQELGAEEGYIYIFDVNTFLYVNETQSVDVTNKIKTKVGID